MKRPFCVVVADQDPQVFSELQQYNGLVLQFIHYSSTSDDAIKACLELKPDLVLLDLLPDLGGEEVLKRLSHQIDRPRVMIYTSREYEHIFKGVGSEYYILKPFCTKTLLKRIVQIIDISMAKKVLLPRESIKEMISAFLSDLGLSNRNSGHRYLVEAILMAVEMPDKLNNLQHRLYPLIAERYQKTVNQVERAIRYSIETAWLTGNIQVLQTLFHHLHCEKGKPTNHHFIATVSDHIRLLVKKGPGGA